MCSSFCEKIHNIRVLWNDLAFKSFLCSLSIRFYKFGTLPCLLLTWGSDMPRSISGHNMNTSIGLHIRSTSGVSRDNHRKQQLLKNYEAHMQKALCPNSTATRVLLFRVVKQRAKYWQQYLSNGLLVKTLHDRTRPVIYSKDTTNYFFEGKVAVAWSCRG